MNSTKEEIPSRGPMITIPKEHLLPDTQYTFGCYVQRTFNGVDLFTQQVFSSIYVRKIRKIEGNLIANYSGNFVIPGQTPVSLRLNISMDVSDNFMFAWGFIIKDVPVVVQITPYNNISDVVLPSEDPMRNTHLKIFVNVLDADSGIPLGRIVDIVPMGKMFQDMTQMRTGVSNIVNQTAGFINSGNIGEGVRRLMDATTVLDDPSVSITDRKNIQMDVLQTMARMGEMIRQDPSKMKNSDMTMIAMNVRKAVSINTTEVQIANENATRYVEATKQSLKPMLEALFNRQKSINLASDDETITTDTVNELTRQSMSAVDSLMKLKISQKDIGEIHSMVDLTTRAAIVQSPSQTVEFVGERFNLNGAVGSVDNFPSNVSSMVKLDNSSLQGYLEKFMDRNDPQPVFLRVFDSKDDPYNHTQAKPISNVVSFSVSYMGNGSEIRVDNLQAPIQIRIPMTNNTPIANSTVKCAFWNITAQKWDTDNIQTKEGGRLCETTHLTDFALIPVSNPATPIGTSCPNGQYNNGGNCINCPANTFRDGTTTTCQPCPSGTQSSEGSSSCSSIPFVPPPQENSSINTSLSGSVWLLVLLSLVF